MLLYKIRKHLYILGKTAGNKIDHKWSNSKLYKNNLATRIKLSALRRDLWWNNTKWHTIIVGDRFTETDQHTDLRVDRLPGDVHP